MKALHPHPVWIGHIGDGRAFRSLYEHGVRAVVELAAEEGAVALPRDLISFRAPLVDGPGNDPTVIDLAVETAAMLLRRRIPTLVCCGAGMSRSPVVVAAALASVSGRSFDDCLRDVAALGPVDVSPGLLHDVRLIFKRGRETG